MHMFLTQFDFDSTAKVTSSPPYVDDDGDLNDATVILFPFGRRRGTSDARLHMTVDEADELARYLWHVVTDARNGTYTEKA